MRAAIAGAINKIIAANAISKLSNVKKLKGHQAAYRLRIGDYRIGLVLKNQTTVIVAAVAHRKKVYRGFP